MNQMLRQAQALQRKLAKAQEELAEREVRAQSGGGTVTAIFTGTGDIKSIEINPEAVDPEDVEMLQDLIVAAVHEGQRAAKDLESELLGGLAGGMGLPPGLLG